MPRFILCPELESGADFRVPKAPQIPLPPVYVKTGVFLPLTAMSDDEAYVAEKIRLLERRLQGEEDLVLKEDTIRRLNL